MANQIKRSMLKAKYARFCEAWTNERRYQDYLVKNGDPLPEGHNRLGRKPTFAMWMQAVNNKKISSDVNQAPPTENQVDPKAVEVTQTDWE